MIVLSTDSTAYITRQEAKDLGVIYIPMIYSVGDNSYFESFIRDNATFNNAQLARPETVHTSQPSISSLHRRLSHVLEGDYEILLLTLSSRLSGTYANASVCAKELGRRVRVIDTRNAAAGMYLLLKEARKLIDQGLCIDEIEERIKALRDRTKTRFSVTDLAPLRRSGRLGVVRQSIGTILNQRPILSLENGAVVCIDMARGRSEQLRKLLSCVPEGATDLIVEYFSDRETAQEMAERLSQQRGVPVQIRRIGFVLGFHLGFDVIGLAWHEE